MYKRTDWGHVRCQLPRTNVVEWLDAYAYPIVTALRRKGIITTWSCGGHEAGSPIMVVIQLPYKKVVDLAIRIEKRLREQQVTYVPAEGCPVITLKRLLVEEEDALTFYPILQQLGSDDPGLEELDIVGAWNKFILSMQLAVAIDSLDLVDFAARRETFTGKFYTLELVKGKELVNRLEGNLLKLSEMEKEAGLYIKGRLLKEEVTGVRDLAAILDDRLISEEYVIKSNFFERVAYLKKE